jgi:hypothetical protein
MNISCAPFSGRFGDVLLVHHTQRIGEVKLENVTSRLDVKTDGKGIGVYL